MSTHTIAPAFDQRILSAAGDVPLDEETQQPIMTPTQWGKKWVRDLIVDAVRRVEKRKDRESYVATPIPKDSIT